MYEGKLVRLRSMRSEQMRKVQKWSNDFEIRKLLHDGVPYPYKIEEQERHYDGISSIIGQEYQFAVDTLDGIYIGNCGIEEVDWKNSKVEIGIYIGEKEYWSKGYGTDITKTLVKFIFVEMNINKIKLSVFSNNERAVACYKKCGFIEEGILKEEVFREGKYIDEIVMALFRKDWIK